MRTHLRNLVLASAALAAFPAGVPLARADVIHSGMLYVADYGKACSTAISTRMIRRSTRSPASGRTGCGGNTTNAFSWAAAPMPIKEGLQEGPATI